MGLGNKVQLIAYPDSLGGSLAGLRAALDRFFPGCFPGGVHVLPPFPSSGDRGFAPITYAQIDPRFGSWFDIAALGEIGPVMLDVMVNHVSRQSPYFQDFLEKGRASPYADYFIDVRRLWPGGDPPPEDLRKLFLRRALPYSEYAIRTGGQARVWTTFGHDDPSEQIDLDLESPAVMSMLGETLSSLRGRGVGILRLDAIGYIVKRPGTSCFFVEPAIWEAMGRIRAIAEELGIDLLPEVHAPLEIQRKLSGHGYWGYDFALPFLILDALVSRDGTELARYLRDRPRRLVTMLDCHDGIPVKPDLDGFMDEARARRTVDVCVSRGAQLSRVSGSHRSPDGFDVHQVCCTYYSALGSDDDAYIAARAIQLFAPGLPQVYYVGLLAGENDTEAARESGERRDLNRHNYSIEEIARAAEAGVVGRLVELIRLRNESSAFDGEFSIAMPSESEIALRWENGGEFVSAKIDLERYATIIESRDGREGRRSWRA
jgi:sucrose 6(F)-phosphate phosphorylase